MSAANAIAVVAIVAGALVAIVGPWLVAKVNAREGRRDELRDVLDAAAVALRVAIDTADTTRAALNRAHLGEDDLPGQSGVAELLARGHVERLDILRSESRLAMRLGYGHPLVQIYGRARAGTGGLLGATVQAHEGQTASGNPEYVKGWNLARDALFEFYALSATTAGPNVERRWFRHRATGQNTPVRP